MRYDPKTTEYPYPEHTDEHYLVVRKNDGTVFDADYPFVDDTKKYRFKRFLSSILFYALIFPLARVKLGLKINGRENVKKNKEIIKRGIISCSNHVHLWDYISMMKAIRPHKPRVLVWPPNIRGENGKLIRLVGGIPIPDESVRATESYIKAIKKLLEGGGWLHVYAEGSMWEYYAPIRPFKRGIGYFSCRFGKPVLPIAFSYRKPGFIRKKIFKQKACLTLTVGEPIFPNGNLALKERERDMVERCHKAVRELAGITEEENMYPPVFDKNERIDYYAAEYGVKDKK